MSWVPTCTHPWLDLTISKLDIETETVLISYKVVVFFNGKCFFHISQREQGQTSAHTPRKVSLTTPTMQRPPFFASFINCLAQEAGFPVDIRTSPQTHGAPPGCQAQPTQQLNTFSGGCSTSTALDSSGIRPFSPGMLPTAETGSCTLALVPGRVLPFIAGLCFSWRAVLVFLWSLMLSSVSKRLPENLEIGSWGVKIKKR